MVEGIIIAPNNHSPEEEVKRHKYAPGWDGQHWPNLRRWSDVVFLEWKHQADHYHKSPKSLRYVLRNNIVNEKAQEIAERAVGPDGPKEWDDAEEISTESDEGKALLYSPNARGVAWLLAQHKEVLGLKTIRGIKVFSDVEGCWATWHMLLIIVPV